MINFNEWLSGHCQTTEGYLNPGDFYDTGAEDGWKAALEWALTQRSAGWEEDGTISCCNFIFTDVIKEELNE